MSGIADQKLIEQVLPSDTHKQLSPHFFYRDGLKIYRPAKHKKTFFPAPVSSPKESPDTPEEGRFYRTPTNFL